MGFYTNCTTILSCSDDFVAVVVVMCFDAEFATALTPQSSLLRRH